MNLSALLHEAESASPMHRIEWRDRIAAHGDKAITGVEPWLAHPLLAAFAIRVIERAGTNGEMALATQVLRSARPNVPERDRRDVDWALQQIKARSRASVEGPVQPAPPVAASAAPRRAFRERAHLSAVARRRPR
jgi:hypothetical protein